MKTLKFAFFGSLVSFAVCLASCQTAGGETSRVAEIEALITKAEACEAKGEHYCAAFQYQLITEIEGFEKNLDVSALYGRQASNLYLWTQSERSFFTQERKQQTLEDILGLLDFVEERNSYFYVVVLLELANDHYSKCGAEYNQAVSLIGKILETDTDMVDKSDYPSEMYEGTQEGVQYLLTKNNCRK